jgi:CheY-like chemotaxis protein
MKHKIMLVDDSMVNRRYLREIFEEEGFEVFEAEKGVEALEEIATVRPDVMILDLLMPGISGIETLISIRARGFSFPIIIHTADYQKDVKQQCLAAGATVFVNKPTTPKQIVGIVEKCLTQ